MRPARARADAGSIWLRQHILAIGKARPAAGRSGRGAPGCASREVLKPECVGIAELCPSTRAAPTDRGASCGSASRRERRAASRTSISRAETRVVGCRRRLTTRGGVRPALGGSAEDDGWVLALVYDDRTGFSHLAVLDARAPAAARAPAPISTTTSRRRSTAPRSRAGSAHRARWKAPEEAPAAPAVPRRRPRSL
jgi:hypothetical protein